MKLWLIAIGGVALVAVLVILGEGKTIPVAGWFMVGVLWLLFVWLVSTVIAKRPTRRNL